MCLGLTGRDFITDVKFENNPDLDNPDYSMNTIDLNETTDGSPVYMYTSKTRLDFTIPLKMDTAFVFDNFIYFIIFDKFYRFDKKYRVSDPFPVVEKFGKLPENINGAFVYGGDNKLYFFSGELVFHIMSINENF